VITLSQAIALGRHGALSRPVFGKPRGTRTHAASRKVPVPGHYYPGTTAAFCVESARLDIDLYIDAMRTAPVELRNAAVEVIAEFGDASCVPALGEVLIDTKQDVSTRNRAAGALATIGGPEAEAFLWHALESPAYPFNVREDVLTALLDLLTPQGWDNYTFMNNTTVPLPAAIRDRMLALRHDIPYIDEIVRLFDCEVP
jgi:hypothetical protein